MRRALAIVLGGVALAGPAAAETLQLPAGAPLWMQLGADAILWLHIGGGAVGLVAGAIALLSRKGGPLHRRMGAVFLVSMLTMAGIGAAVAPFLGDRISTVAGVMTFYLVGTGVLAARRRSGAGALEVVGLAVAVMGMAVTLGLLWMARQSPDGTLDGSPPQAFYIFALVSTIAAAGDLKVVLRRGINGAQRIARHVWRMTFGLFVAAGSLFLGQMQVFPVWLRDTPVLYVLGLSPLPFLVFWMLRVRLSKTYRTATA